MTETPQERGPLETALLEYVLVSAGDADGLVPVATAIVELVRAGSLRLLDVVVLVREPGSTKVRAGPPEGHDVLAPLTAAVAGSVLLSAHDVELASATLDPGETSLLLLVEDSWGASLFDAARAGGARVTAGERIARERVHVSFTRADATDLIIRSPVTTPLLDQVSQVRELAHLVERGLLPLDSYEIQRRRVLAG